MKKQRSRKPRKKRQSERRIAKWLSFIRRNITLLVTVGSSIGFAFTAYAYVTERADKCRYTNYERRQAVRDAANEANIRFRREISNPTKRTENAAVLDRIVVAQGLNLDDRIRHLLYLTAGAVRQVDRCTAKGDMIEAEKWLRIADEKSNELLPALVVASRLSVTPEESPEGFNL